MVVSVSSYIGLPLGVICGVRLPYLAPNMEMTI